MSLKLSEEDKLALREAIASGASRVQHRDSSVQYRPLEEMMRVHALSESESVPDGHVRGRTYAQFNKGIR